MLMMKVLKIIQNLKKMIPVIVVKLMIAETGQK